MKQVDASPIQWRCLAALLMLLTLNQCALPPGSAWTVIRRDGFKDYLAVSWGKKPVPDYVKELLPEAFGETRRAEDSGDSVEQPEGANLSLANNDEFPALPSDMPQDWARPVEPVFPLMSTEPPEFPSLTPPILVQGESPNPSMESVSLKTDEFAQVSIPDFLNEPGMLIKSPEGEGLKPAPGLKMKDAPLMSEMTKSSDHPVKAIVETAQVPKVAADFPAGAPKAIEESTKVAEVADVAGSSSDKKKDDNIEKFLPVMPALSGDGTIPFGLIVSGRPGYVRSPFAEAHQLVDVTGLKVGESVTCPFSGKSFRVPALHEAMQQKPSLEKEPTESKSKEDVNPSE